ncbi:MAG: beta-ketoacyl-ACP synthase II [Acidimicrobiia bacterium]|nr:beta-ketoacyl-ACP synthase II [Acidimicrobiia bacterium]
MTELHDRTGRPRVVVTGIGLRTPAGSDPGVVWAAMLSGRSTAGPIRRFDPSDLPVRFGCEVRDFDPESYLGPKESRRTDRATQFGVAAGLDAVADAGPLDVEAGRAAVVAGTGVGGLGTLEDQIGTYHLKGAARVSPMFVPMMMPNATAAALAIKLGWTGPNVCIATACAAGGHALGEALRTLRSGDADVVLTGGTESAVTPTAIAAFARMGALSRRHDDPAAACRPFDADRDGFVLSEGAAFLVLETLERALTRDARIYGELAGYGRNSDAHHVTAPAPEGRGARECIRLALADAGLGPDEVGHINAHGTSTPLNDAAEAGAIHAVFGDRPVPVTSTKGVTGHMIGAAGAVEAIAALLAMRDGLVPPTANHSRRGDDVPVDVVAGTPREVPADPVVSNSFGFGGHNACLVLRPA